MRSVPRSLILFAATTGYQIRTFADAARRLGIELTLATDRCHVLDDPWADRALPVRFDRVEESLELLRGRHFDGISAVGDRPAVLAAYAAAMLDIPFHPPAAATACNDKLIARRMFQRAGMPVPKHFLATFDQSAAEWAAHAAFPCVLKPRGESASRGVIRADNPAEFIAAFQRIQRMCEQSLIVEQYIDGREYAVEGLVTRGCFQPLAIFDKPDPLEGPFFEETIYVTPSRAPAATQQEILAATERAIQALGLQHGPIHAELRHDSEGAWILEVAARPIGGLCSRTLRFRPDLPLEELILRHALGESFPQPRPADLASGVMMIPIPKDGIYQSVEGVERARAVRGIEDLIITAKEGQRIRPLPEGASYLGFVFARGETPAHVEAALRRSHAELHFQITTVLETFKPSP